MAAAAGDDPQLQKLQAEFDALMAEGGDDTPAKGRRAVKVGVKLSKRLKKARQVVRARAVLDRVWQAQVALHGEKHEDTASTLVRMGELAEMGGSYAEAVGFLNRALVVFEACLGVDHDETTKTALKLAAIQSHQSDYYQQALTMYEQALEIKLENIGENHISTAMTIVNMGAVYREKGDLTRALDYFSRGLAIRAKIQGPMHNDTATAVDNVAQVYRMEGDYKSALRYYQWALSIRKMALGDDDLQTADTLYNVALVQRHLKEYAASAESFEEAAEIFSKAHGDKHADVKDARIQANRMRQLSEYSSV